MGQNARGVALKCLALSQTGKGREAELELAIDAEFTVERVKHIHKTYQDLRFSS